jgi:hypothetical protein
VLGDGEDRWWAIDSSTDLDRIADEVLRALEAEGLPWLDARAGLDKLMTLARTNPEQFPRYLLGRFKMLLADAGHHQLAAEIAQ